MYLSMYVLLIPMLLCYDIKTIIDNQKKQFSRFCEISKYVVLLLTLWKFILFAELLISLVKRFCVVRFLFH